MAEPLSCVEAQMAERGSQCKLNMAHSFTILPEWFRLFGYVGFWFTVLVGVILTDNFSGIDKNDTLLMDIFGYNNICVNFDFSPSTKVLPAVWAVTSFILLTYLFVQHLALIGATQAGEVTQTQANVMFYLTFFCSMSIILFSVIFAVPPTGPNITMWIHTLPFLGLQTGLVVLAWTDLLMNQWVFNNTYPRGKWGYLIAFTVTVSVKQTLALNMLFGMPSCVQVAPKLSKGLGGFECQGAFFVNPTTFAQMVDHAFMLFSAVIPMMHSMYLMCFKRDELYVVDIFALVARPKKTG